MPLYSAKMCLKSASVILKNFEMYCTAYAAGNKQTNNILNQLLIKTKQVSVSEVKSSESIE